MFQAKKKLKQLTGKCETSTMMIIYILNQKCSMSSEFSQEYILILTSLKTLQTYLKLSKWGLTWCVVSSWCLLLAYLVDMGLRRLSWCRWERRSFWTLLSVYLLVSIVPYMLFNFSISDEYVILNILSDSFTPLWRIICVLRTGHYRIIYFISLPFIIFYHLLAMLADFKLKFWVVILSCENLFIF